ncbi:MAG: hypothetical protein VYB59_09080 [Pseudomonadota bacterium]|nr:hypothetical protein [Pseudomonadota bacterium]
MTGTKISLLMTDRITNVTQSKQIPRYGKLQDRDWDRGDYVFRLDRQDAPSEDTELAGDQSGYEAYLAQFSKGRFAAAAKVKIASSRPPTTNEEDAELRRLRRERQKPAAERAWLREDTARARAELENQR